MQIWIFTSVCIFFKIRESGFNSLPTPFKKGKPQRLYPCYFTDVTKSSALAAPSDTRFPHNINSRILHCWCASVTSVHSPHLPCLQQVGIAAVTNGDGKAGWLTSSSPTWSQCPVPCAWRGRGTTSSGRIRRFSASRQCERRMRISAAGSSWHPQIWICRC